jgi:RNA polymerase sigma-70 factor (ECF subfamily)
LLLRLREPHDVEAWQTFVDIYGPLIYRWCRGRDLQDADAAEVTQEVLLQVCRSIHKFEYRPEHGRFRDWLGTVTQNKIRRFFRKRAGEVPVWNNTDLGNVLERMASAEQDAEWTEQFNEHILATALARIRPHFEEQTWRAFELTWLENCPAAQVAQELGQRTDWVYLSKWRVLKRLQELVQELAEDQPRFVP